jgi:hypothetical protein
MAKNPQKCQNMLKSELIVFSYNLSLLCRLWSLRSHWAYMTLLVIQVHGSHMATREEQVADWKILMNQWRHEHSLRE